MGDKATPHDCYETHGMGPHREWLKQAEVSALRAVEAAARKLAAQDDIAATTGDSEESLLGATLDLKDTLATLDRLRAQGKQAEGRPAEEGVRGT